MSTLKVDTIQGKTTAGTVAMPEGSLVQYKRVSTQANTGIYNTNSYNHLSPFDLAITPKFATSKLIIKACMPVYVNTNAYPSAWFAFYRDGTIISQHNVTYGSGYSQINTGQVAAFTPYIEADVTANNTNSTTFSIYIKCNTSGNNAAMNDVCNRWLAIEEIKQ
jgi:hypothetical protein